MWIKFLMKNWHFIVIVILLTTNAFTVNLYLDKRDELTVCVTNYEGKKAEVVSCNNLIGEQNTAIGEWKAKGKALEERVRNLTEDFGVIQEKNTIKINKILNAEVPESCEGSMEWLVDQGKKK